MSESTEETHELSADQARQLRFGAGIAFSPSAPIDKQSLFAGRTRQLEAMIDAITMRGRHVILFGERGVGKTSLTTVLKDIFEQSAKAIQFVRVNCDSGDTYSSIWHKVLKDLQLVARTQPMGFDREPSTMSSPLSSYFGAELSPDDVRSALSTIGGSVVVLDEFDRLTDQTAKTRMADTIKSLSDNAVNATLVVVGVADSVSDLIMQHESIDRALTQILMPRMTDEELQETLIKALAGLFFQGVPRFKLDDMAARRIVRLSQGLPHYTHLLGLASTRSALARRATRIVLSDVVEGTFSALQDAQQSILQSYHLATDSNRKDSLFRQVLLACALASTDQRGYFAAGDLREPLSIIMKKPYDIPHFARHLGDFCEDKRGAVLTKTGPARSLRYRFSNPLLQPFVLMRALSDGMISGPELDGMDFKAVRSRI